MPSTRHDMAQYRRQSFRGELLFLVQRGWCPTTMVNASTKVTGKAIAGGWRTITIGIATGTVTIVTTATETETKSPAISRQRAIHLSLRSTAICSNVRPSASSVAFLPLNCSHRCTITSMYLGSSSRPQHMRSVSSAAANVVPLPRNG